MPRRGQRKHLTSRKRTRSMPIVLRSPRAKVKRKQWTNEQMEQAMSAVRSGQSGVSRVALDHGVPRTTLKDRLSGRVCILCWYVWNCLRSESLRSLISLLITIGWRFFILHYYIPSGHSLCNSHLSPFQCQLSIATEFSSLAPQSPVTITPGSVSISKGWSQYFTLHAAVASQ